MTLQLTSFQHDQLHRLFQQHTAYSSFTHDARIRQGIIANIQFDMRCGDPYQKGFIHDGNILSQRDRVLLFRGISQIITPDSEEWNIRPLLGSQNIKSPSLREVYSWKSPASNVNIIFIQAQVVLKIQMRWQCGHSPLMKFSTDRAPVLTQILMKAGYSVSPTANQMMMALSLRFQPRMIMALSLLESHDLTTRANGRHSDQPSMQRFL
jgi:hypothetical protein